MRFAHYAVSAGAALFLLHSAHAQPGGELGISFRCAKFGYSLLCTTTVCCYNTYVKQYYIMKCSVRSRLLADGFTTPPQDFIS